MSRATVPDHRDGGNTFGVADPFSWERVRAAYDAASSDYAVAFGDDLARLPLDRHMLGQAQRAADDGVLLDLGCGTGSVGSYLTKRGARVVGLDLSFGMLTSHRSEDRFPLCQGDMRQLPFRNGAFAAVVAYYSIQHVTRMELGSVLGEVARVLESRGALLLGTHLGEGEVYVDEFLGHHIATTGGSLYSSQEITDHVSARGFVVETSERRGPLEHEHQSQRIYLLARRTE
jgi:ubiquinone/menaquinone biosynthesis C-methylase UbiE